MKYIAFAFVAAAACLTAVPAGAQSLSIGVGDSPRYGDRDRGRVEIRDGRRDYARDRIIVRRGSDCRTVVVRTRTPSGNVIIRRTRRCG
jgi:hypothetical protein